MYVINDIVQQNLTGYILLTYLLNFGLGIRYIQYIAGMCVYMIDDEPGAWK